MTKLWRQPKIGREKRPGVRECRVLLRKLGAWSDAVHVQYDGSVGGYDALTQLVSVNAVPKKKDALAALHAALTVLAEGSK